MSGSEIGNFSHETLADPKSNKSNFSSDVELKLRSSSEKTILEEEIHDKGRDFEKLNLLSRVIISIRSSMSNFFISNKKYVKYFFHVGLQILLASYLVAAVVVYNTKGHDIEYWKGLGLLIVLYCLVYGSLFYYLVVKRYCGTKFKDFVITPLRKCCGCIWEIKVFRCVIILAPGVLLLVYLCLDFEKNQKKLVSLSGIVVFMAFGFIFSKNPGRIQWRPVFTGLILQYVFALITLKWDIGRSVLQQFSEHTSNFLNYTSNGTAFVYGPLVSDSFVYDYGSILAFSALPVIFFFSFFVNILSYYNALQWFILKFAWVVHMVMGTTVCESANAAANVFFGATESILLFKHQIKDLTKSELHAIMCEGWSTVGGTVLAAYISFGISPSHLIAASVMSAPASLSYSKLFYPETEKSKTTFKNIVLNREEGNNVLDAACRGAVASLVLVGNIIATLIAFLGFIAFLDNVIKWAGILIGIPELSFQFFLTKIFVPVTFIMGVDDESLEDVALLIGTKTFVNEFRAYELMKTMKHRFSPRTEAIATYALCGFSNFASIGIFLGVISALEPSQTPHATEVATRAFIAASIVCCLTACVAGTLLDV